MYSLGTPNGKKISILLEELGVDYDAHYIDIGKGEQFSSGFVQVNPNSKIPALIHYNAQDGQNIHLFESGSMVLYLAEKYNQFIPKDPLLKAEVMNWVFWQMATQGPMTGNFGHFFVYAPADKIETRNYGVARYGMEVQRICDVLDKHLEGKEFIVGNEYTIADIMILPWFDQLRTGYIHTSGVAAKDFLSIDKYTNSNRWADKLLSRPQVQRGMEVCLNGVGKPWLEQQNDSSK